MAYYLLQADFSKGEITKFLGARADIDFWRQALAECLNFNVLMFGGLRRRSGTRFVAEVKDSTALARLFPFKFSEAQSYVLCLNGGSIRFHALRGVVGAPYEVSHPYADNDLFRLSYEQFNDVAYLAHKSYAPRRLSRIADTNWTLTTADFKDGPYLELPRTTTTLKPSHTGHATPVMTSNTLPSGTVSASNGSNEAYKIFNRKKDEIVTLSSSASGWVAYDFGVGNGKVVNSYWVTADQKAHQHGDSPRQWDLQGSHDGTNWVTLDTRDGETGWSGSETRFFSFDNETAFRHYRLSFSGGGGSDANVTSLAELALGESGDTMTPFDLTASSTDGINGGAGFQSSDVGRTITIRGADGRWRWLRITSVTSTTVVKVKLYGYPLPDTSPISMWRMGAFSGNSGYPGSVCLFNERLMWARTDAEPVTVYGSKQGIFDDFGISDPQQDTDGMKITLLSSGMDEILWLVGDEDLIAGSAGQIRIVGPADITKAFSATNITQRKGPTSGASHIKPLSIGGVTLYVGAGGTKIRELVLGEQNRYIAPELSLLGEHFFKSGIVDWAFAERPEPVIYCVLGNGQLVSVTYDREQRVVGFGRHQIAGGLVESVAVVPSAEPGFDDVYLVVRREINGQTKRYIEVLERPFDGDTDDVEDGFFVDCGLSYDGSPISIVTGLDHLEGEEVAVLADGGVVDGLTVSSGSITLPYAASKIHVGLRYKSRGVTLPMAGPQQDGTLFGRRRTVQSVFADVLYSGSLMVGSAGGDGVEPRLYEQIFKPQSLLFGNKVSLVSGDVHCKIEGSWVRGDGKIVFETDKPLPLLVRALTFQLEGEP